MDFPASAQATRGPLWDEAWECLRQEMIHRFHFATAETWDGRMESKKLVGECWMYDGTYYVDDTCALTGIRTLGWFHNFRHRGVDQNGGQRMVRKYLSRLDPRKIAGTEVKDGFKSTDIVVPAPVVVAPVPVKTVSSPAPVGRKVVDDGKPF